jgi:hypothetical protein
VSGDAERAWIAEHGKFCDCPESDRVRGSYHPSGKKKFLAGFAARDAEIVGLKDLLAKWRDWHSWPPRIDIAVGALRLEQIVEATDAALAAPASGAKP